LSGVSRRKTSMTGEIINWIETQATAFFVDGAIGSDTDGDGSLYKPFATPDKAIQAGVARGDDVIEIVINPNHGVYTADVPDGTEVSFSTLSSLIGGGPSQAFTIIALGDASILHIDNLYILEIREKTGTSSAVLWAEECLLGGIRNFDGSGPASNITANFSDTYLTGTAMVDIESLPEINGTVIDWTTRKRYVLNGISMIGERVEEIGAPVNADDASTKGYVDTEITNGIATHTAIADAHHSRYTDAEAQTAVHYRPDVNLAGETPVDSDVSAWADGDRGHGIGTTGREFYMIKRGTTVKWVEMD